MKYFNDYTLDIYYGSRMLIIYANRIEIINGVEQAIAWSGSGQCSISILVFVVLSRSIVTNELN